MRKVVLVAAMVGFLIAISMGLAWFYMYSHGLSDTSGAHAFVRINRYVWPTVFILMDADKADLGTLIMFLTSALLNASIYAFLAFCLYGVWKRFLQRNSEPPECG